MEVHIESDVCRLVARHWRGSGEPVLLLHGLGSSLLAWSALVPTLTAHHEVIALDLRGHGRSTSAPWSWPAAVADIDAVLAHFGISEAHLVGHSLGGILAVLYASRRPRTASVINIDGHTSTDLRLFRGLDPRSAQEKLAALRRVQERYAARHLDREKVLAIADAAESRAWENGESREDAREAIFRCLEQLSPGNFRLRPGPQELSSLLDALDEINVLALYAQLVCRCLVLCATAATQPPPEQRWLAELQQARIVGQTLELQALARADPTLQVELVPSTHPRMLREKRVASLVTTFLDHHLHKGDDNAETFPCSRSSHVGSRRCVRRSFDRSDHPR